MTFVEQLRQLDFKDIGRWPFLFRALGVAIVLVFTTLLLVWYFVWGENGNRPQLLKAQAEQKSLWATFDEKQRKAANLEAYRQQLAEIERTFGAMLRQLPGKTEVPSLLVDISQTGLAAGLQERRGVMEQGIHRAASLPDLQFAAAKKKVLLRSPG